MKPDQRGSRTLLSAGLLTTTGGFLDAYTYYTRGGVFANAQTGNIIKLGIAVAEGQPGAGVRYLLPIAAFMLRVVMSIEVERWFDAHHPAYPRRAVLAVETLLLAVVAFIPQSEGSNTIANALISLLCGMQMQSFQIFRRQGMATTVAMGNLRKTVELLDSAVAWHDRERLIQSAEFFWVILLFILGVIVGAVCSRRFGIHACLCAALLLLLNFINIGIVYRKVNGEER